jgi:IS1 family transposase
MSYGVWSNTPRFVGKKRVKKEVWLAIDRKTSELKKRFHVGGRGREEARKFWQSLPPVYRSGCCSTPNVQLWWGVAPPLVINGKLTKE